MLTLGLQYVEPATRYETASHTNGCTSFCRIVLHRKIFLDSKPKADSISMAPASANAVTRVVEELVTEGLLPRVQVHLYVEDALCSACVYLLTPADILIVLE